MNKLDLNSDYHFPEQVSHQKTKVSTDKIQLKIMNYIYEIMIIKKVKIPGGRRERSKIFELVLHIPLSSTPLFMSEESLDVSRDSPLEA